MSPDPLAVSRADAELLLGVRCQVETDGLGLSLDLLLGWLVCDGTKAPDGNASLDDGGDDQ